MSSKPIYTGLLLVLYCLMAGATIVPLENEQEKPEPNYENSTLELVHVVNNDKVFKVYICFKFMRCVQQLIVRNYLYKQSWDHIKYLGESEL